MMRAWTWLTQGRPRRGPKVDALRAQARAQHDLGRTAEKWHDVDQLTTELRRLRRANHFAEGFRRTL